MLKKHLLFLLGITLSGLAFSAPKPLSRDPYLGAIVVDANTGDILFQDRARVIGKPASMTKMMTYLLTIEAVKRGDISFDTPVIITAESSRIGGSQVYLKEGEQFTINELLDALMIKSANDVARALALHLGGSRENFALLMNERALELGMYGSDFHNASGLNFSGMTENTTTAQDMATLARELLKHPETIGYTACKYRTFRNGTFDLRTHNKLLTEYPGCVGLKTGYYYMAGWSIATAATRNDETVIAIALGSPNKLTRNKAAKKLLDIGFARIQQRKKAEASQPVRRHITRTIAY